MAAKLLQLLLIFITLGLSFVSSSEFYSTNSDIIELTVKNFKKEVIESDSFWVVAFCAPWCKHCQNLVPEYNKAAKALKGIAKVGVVDMTQHQSVGGPYNVQGFPTIKIFGCDKNKPTDFNGARTADALVHSVISALQNTSRNNSCPLSSFEDKYDVVELTDSNFEAVVLNSTAAWVINFFAPWCQHCKDLEPHWNAVASELKGMLRFGKVDGTINPKILKLYNVTVAPTIKFFSANNKNISFTVDYDNGFTKDNIALWISLMVDEKCPFYKIKEIISQKDYDDICEGKELCIIAFVPHLSECSEECRKHLNEIFGYYSDLFSYNNWGWLWTEIGQHSALEYALGIESKTNYCLVAVSKSRGLCRILESPFTKKDIYGFLLKSHFDEVWRKGKII